MYGRSAARNIYGVNRTENTKTKTAGILGDNSNKAKMVPKLASKYININLNSL
jgi:hypothetical protein